MHNLRCSRSPGFPSISYCLMLQRVCHPHSKRKQIRKMPSLSTLEKRSGKSAFCLGTGAARWGCWYRVWEPCETSLDSLSLNRCRNVWWLPCWFLLMYLCVFYARPLLLFSCIDQFEPLPQSCLRSVAPPVWDLNPFGDYDYETGLSVPKYK